jgi:16S rRNA (uracil1498-N3)-methyltransferase
MTRKRVWVEAIDPGQEKVVLTGQTAHHLAAVLRMSPGDRLEIVDAGGREWLGRIESVGKSGVCVKLLARNEASKESPLVLTLALAFSRSEKMDQVVRQATEMGVARLVAFRARRSQYGLEGADRAKKLERWQKIAREALCQCRRQRKPECVIVSDVEELLERADRWFPSPGETLRILASEDESRKSLVDLQRGSSFCINFIAVIGPEGGWTADETRLFSGKGFHSVHLGPRVLRLETAAVALLASIQLLWGDLGVSGRIGKRDEPQGGMVNGH